MGARTPRNLQALVDAQMRRWSAEDVPQTSPEIRWPLIAVSREFAAEGGVLAKAVADRLGFSFWDHELLHAIAEHTGADESLLESLDEHARSRLDDFLVQTLVGVMATEAEYVRQVVNVIHRLDLSGSAVVVGRGAQYSLPPDRALRVRVVAPLEHRVTWLAQAESISEKEAAKRINHVEKDRQKFVRQHFNRDVTNPRDYDLLVNAGKLDIDAAVAAISEAYQTKFGRLPILT